MRCGQSRQSRTGSLRDGLAKWRRRSGRERAALLEALTLLGFARLAILALPFRWVAASLGKVREESGHDLSPTDLDMARSVGKAVGTASRYAPWQSACLAQAIAARWMLKRRRVPATVYLGVAKDDTKPEKMVAHAWLRSGPVILTGGEGHASFTVVAVFS